MAALGFRADVRGELLQWRTPTLAQYQSPWASGSSSYLRLLGHSAGMALAVATSATVLAYPVAYFLAFRAGLYLAVLLVPFLTSYLLSVMAWKFLLGSKGAPTRC